MSDGQGETMRQIDADAGRPPCERCIHKEFPHRGWCYMFRGAPYLPECGQFTPARTGPPMAYQATGGANHQRTGWRYRPLNEAAVAHQMRHVAGLMQELANAMAAVGMGRGVWPEKSAELLGASRMLREWAEAVGGVEP